MNLAQAILTALSRVDDRGLYRPTLHADVCMILSEPPTPSILDRELTTLDEEGYVTSVRHRDKGILYVITPKGVARLSS